MESEQGGSGTVSSEAVTDLPVKETLVGGENQTEDPYMIEEDLGEIMVEVVGSDVFLDGISSSTNKDGDLVSGEDTGDLDSHCVNEKTQKTEKTENTEGSGTQKLPEAPAASSNEDDHKLPETVLGVSESSQNLENIEESDARNVSEATDVVSSEDGNKLAESAQGISESRNEENQVVSEKLEVMVTETVHVMSSLEVNKPGTEAVVVSSSEMTESISKQTEEVVERTSVGAERSAEDQKVDNDPAEASVGGEIGVTGVIVDNKEIKGDGIENSGASVGLLTPDNVNNPIEASTEGEIGNPDVVSEGAMEAEGADNNSTSSNRTSPEHMSIPTEAPAAGEIASAERLPSDDNAASNDVIPLEDTSAAEQPNNSSEAFLVGEMASAETSHSGDNAARRDVIPLDDTNEPEHSNYPAEASVVGEIAGAEILLATGDNAASCGLVPLMDTTATEDPSNPAEPSVVQEIVSADIFHTGDNAPSHDVIPQEDAAPEHPSNTADAPAVGEIASAEILHSGDDIANHDVIPLENTTAQAGCQIESTEMYVDPNGECVSSAQVNEASDVVGEVPSVDTDVNHSQIDPSPSLSLDCSHDVIPQEETTVPDACQADPTEVSVDPNNGEHLVSVQVDEAGSVVGTVDHSQIDSNPSLSINCTVSASDDFSPIRAEGEIDNENQRLMEECPGVNSDEVDMMDTSHEQSFVSERDDAMDVDLVDVLDFNDEEYDISKLSGINDNEILKDDQGLQTVTVLQNDEFYSEPTQLGNIGDTAELNKEEGSQGGSDENQAHPANPSSLGDQGFVQADSALYIDQTDLATPIGGATNDQNTEASLVEASDVKEPSQNGMGSDSVVTDSTLVVNDEERGPLESNKSREPEDDSSESCEDDTVEGHSSETRLTDVDEEIELDQDYHQGDEVDDPASESDVRKMSAKDRVKASSILRMHQSGYLSSPEDEGKFAESDLVWGKVKSHPWWPGQIFDPKHASDKAVKHQKKDSYLVAYFGDKSFAWNDAAFLKPFRSHFSQIEKQNTSEMWQNAVKCALGEVSRRVELGLVCSCVPEDAYREIATQVVENAGIQAKSSCRKGVDRSCGATSFEPEQLLQYIRDLAPLAACGADRLDVAISKAQLSAFYRFNGCRLPAGFPSAGTLLENDAETDEVLVSHKSKSVCKDSTQSQTKENSSMEVKDDMEFSSDCEDESVAKEVSVSSVRKRKALDSLGDISDKRANVNGSKISASTIQTPKPSFKIGECIRRVASQLTGCTSTVKAPSDGVGSNGSPSINEQSGKEKMVVSAEYLSVTEMLSQLELMAQDPNKRYDSTGKVATFFSGFRNSIAVSKRVRKKKTDKTTGGSAEDFEFDDVNDSYWTDRIVQNYSEKQLLHNDENGEGNHQVVPLEGAKPVKPARGKPNSKRKFFYGSRPNTSEEEEKAKRLKHATSPAELILNFAERKCVPSEIKLNKTFRRFGPLMESETEVDHESGRARVIFKRGSDAEVAHNSAESFKIFGPVLVNYQIGYSPLISVKILPVALPQGHDDSTLML